MEIKMLKSILILIVMIVFSNNFVNANDCENIECDPNVPYQQFYTQFPSVDCPDCIFEANFEYRIVTCDDGDEVQVNIHNFGYVSAECFDGTCWEVYEQASLVESMMKSFIAYIRTIPIIWGTEGIAKIYTKPCWNLQPVAGTHGWVWGSCEGNVCCKFIWNYEVVNGEVQLTDPVFIQPDFMECNPLFDDEYPNSEICYSICGLMDPTVLLMKDVNYSDNFISFIEPRVYPNPANNSIEIQTFFEQEGNYTLSVFDVNGSLIESINYNESYNFRIDLSSYSNGTYFYHIKLQNRIIFNNGKFIVNK